MEQKIVLAVIGILSAATIYASKLTAETSPITFEVYEDQGVSLIVTSYNGSVREISLNDPVCEEIGQCDILSYSRFVLPFQGSLWDDNEGFLVTTTDSFQRGLWDQYQELSFVIKTPAGNQSVTFSGPPVEVAHQQDLPTVLDYCCAEHVRCARFYEEQCE